MDRLWTKNFIMLTITALLLFSGFYLLMPTLPMLIKQLGGSESQVGFIIGVFTISAVIFRPIVGGLMDRYGRRVFIISGLLFFAMTMYFYDWVTGVIFLVVLRILHGISWAIATTSIGTAVTDVIPQSRRGVGMGWYGLAMTLGMALGPILGLWVAKSFSFHYLFLLCTALALMAFIFALNTKIPVVKNTAKQPISFFEKTVLPIAIVTFFLSITFGGITTFLPLFAENIQVNAGTFFLVYAVTLTVIRPLAGKISDKYGEGVIIVPTLFILIVALLVLTMTKGLVGLVLTAILYGIGFGSAQPALQIATLRIAPPEKRGVANATFFTAFDLGIGLGAILLGLVSQLMGYQMLFIVCAGSGFVSVIIFILFVKKDLEYLFYKDMMTGAWRIPLRGPYEMEK
ncbi:MFS transporter [Brevibacillus porteri]|uniref:MFS transporter n=1 Tax=Brevibacillus porteri TaxID=2126350 RepID=A0ABX5FZD3_9BACL|nr:MFS transporter [Brevibacillus porteri]MED1797718.1 MFS transporter [Brevibacillus porteri]MED2130542.1 MFS transporter [Brevibacillus porteri]MED2745290.1 MFS transporter [Brevibacillus porteri]MED2812780.1 MFS transporter [Brevibacillus porteri]MED2895245.1 MFS transporter [Brevibacillus porteri]